MTDADKRNLLAAEAKRQHKNEKRLYNARRSVANQYTHFA